MIIKQIELGIRSVLALLLLFCSTSIGYAQSVDLRDSTRYMALIDSSFTLGNKGNYSGAEDLLKQAIQLIPQHPANIFLSNNLGGVQQLLGKPEEALQSYSSALSRQPDNPTTRFNRARLYALLGKHNAAITDYSLLVGKSPTNELYLYQRAMSYMLTKQYDLAENDLRAIIEHNGESLKARLGYALLETARGRYNEAERLFDYLTTKLSNSPDVYEGRARLYLARKMKGYAIRDVERAFELSKGHPSATLYRLRAEINETLGDKQSAKQDIERAQQIELRVDPLKAN